MTHQERNDWIVKNQALAYKVATRLKKLTRGTSVTFDDLAGEALLGLVKGTEQYDAEKGSEIGAKLSTYAYQAAWNRASRFLQGQRSDVRGPYHRPDVKPRCFSADRAADDASIPASREDGYFFLGADDGYDAQQHAVVERKQRARQVRKVVRDRIRNPRHRHAAWQCLALGRRHCDLAPELGVSPSGVDNAVECARRSLREALAELA